MFKKDNKMLIINRTLLLFASFVATYLYFINVLLQMKELNTLLVDLMFFTIWSNIFIFIWAIFGFISLFQASDKLEKILNHWLIKGTPLIWIGVTFLVFNFYLVPYIFIGRGFKDGLLIIFGWSFFQHFLVPIFMINDFVLTKGITSKAKRWNNKEIAKNTTISIIIPAIWLSLSLILISQNIIPPQYPFMNLFNVSDKELATNLIILIIISFMYIGFFIGIFVIDNKINHSKKIKDNL